MNTIHTFWTLCKKYDKIEVPIIQRDYVQGRNTPEVIRLRKKFINDFLINSLLEGHKVELDFVYGSVLLEKANKKDEEIFIPLDGQQRLTTLFLLHFFIALKEDRLDDVRISLSKFTYETRPSAHDFCTSLITKFNCNKLQDIKVEILDSEWYSELWNNDPTVSGMINMLDTFSKNEKLLRTEMLLLDKLINDDAFLLSFYFIPLEKFGLTENLYIRMNARGKMLTEFENFKSEFYKIINYNHDLLQQVKDKIEYDWVNNLWDYRDKKTYVIDQPFMNYLGFITEMLYYKNAEFRGLNYESDFLDFKTLNAVYKDEDNLKFLIFSLDFLSSIKGMKQNSILWQKSSSLSQILIKVIKDNPSTEDMFIMFGSISYFYQNKSELNFFDFIRVLRNLIHNTNDNSRREWPRLIASFNNMIRNENVYELLLKDEFVDSLEGYYIPQRKEEQFKAKLFKLYPEKKNLILEIEDDENFAGNITNIFLINNGDSKVNIEELPIENFHFSSLEKIYHAYLKISKNKFTEIWGNLLITNLYSQTNESRLIYDLDYKKSLPILSFAKKYSKSKLYGNLGDFLERLEKDFIILQVKANPSFSDIKDVKKQLYLYYIMHKQLYQKDEFSFFKNGWNFGWLEKETGYKSAFNSGVKGCLYFNSINPIFQTYSSQFRYNLGINAKNTLDEEILGIGNKRDPFRLLQEWAE